MINIQELFNQLFHKLKKSGLRTKFFLALLSVCLIGIIVESAGVLLFSRKEAGAGFLRELEITSEYVNNWIDQYFLSINERMSFIENIESLGVGKSNDIKRLMLVNVKRNEDFVGIYTLSNEGKTTNKVFSKEFEASKAALDLSKDETYLRAKNTGVVQLSKVKIVLNRLVLNYVYPLKNRQGYVYITLDLSRLQTRLSEISSKTIMEIYLIDRSGAIMLSSQRSDVGKVFSKLRIDENNINVRFVNPSGKLVLGATKNSMIDGTSLIVGRQKNLIYASQGSIISVTVLWILVTVGIVYLLSVLFSGYVITPLLGLVSGMKIVTQGNYGYKIPERSDDEIGLPVQTFNRMSQTIRNHTDELLKRERQDTINQLSTALGQHLRASAMSVNMAISWMIKGKSEVSMADILRLTSLIKKETASISKLSDNLLLYSRERFPVREEINVTFLITEAVNEVNIPVNIQLKSEIAPGLYMLAEFNEIKQVIINLIENSVDALNNGGEIVVGAQGDDRKVRVWVQDNGPGISDDNMLRIFDPLFSTKHDRAGLGLAIIRNVIARHSADIEVESEQNVLTRFTLTFDKSNLLGAKT